MLPTLHDIISAYRLLLQREPDAQGLAHCGEQMLAGSLTTAELCSSLISSVEYREMQRARFTRVDLGGAILLVDPLEPEFGRHIATHGSWEPHIAAVLRELLRPGDTMLDIGANIGVMSLQAAALVGATGRVIAVEPDGRNHATLLASAAENGFDHLIALRLAFSDRCGLVSMSGNSNGSVIPAGQGADLVQAVTGDMILADLTRLDLVKIDIEGHEPEALAGMMRSIERLRPTFLLEFNPLRLGGIDSARAVAMAGLLFRLGRQVTAICHDETRVALADAAAVRSLWLAQDSRAVQDDWLPQGMVHFDVLIRP